MLNMDYILRVVKGLNGFHIGTWMGKYSLTTAYGPRPRAGIYNVLSRDMWGFT